MIPSTYDLHELAEKRDGLIRLFLSSEPNSLQALFDPPQTCLQTLEVLNNIPQSIEKRLIRIPNKEREEHCSKIEAHFHNLTSWSKHTGHSLPKVIRFLCFFIKIDLIRILHTYFIPNITDVLILYDMIDLKNEKKLKYNTTSHDIQLFQRFFRRNAEVWSPTYTKFQSIQYLRYQKLTDLQKLQYKLRTLNQVMLHKEDWQSEYEVYQAYQAEKVPFQSMLETFEQPWLLHFYFLHYQWCASERITQSLRNLKVKKVQNTIRLINKSSTIHPKQITEGILTKHIQFLVKAKRNFCIFHVGCYLEENDQLYLKYDLSKVEVINLKIAGLFFVDKSKQIYADSLCMLETVTLIIDRIVRRHHIYVYKNYDEFRKLEEKELPALLSKLLICYQSLAKETKKDVLKSQFESIQSAIFFDEQSFFNRIFMFSENYPLFQIEQMIEDMLSLMIALIQRSSKHHYTSYPVFLNHFIRYLNKFIKERSKLSNYINRFLTEIITKISNTAFSKGILPLEEIYELKWKTMAEPTQVQIYKKSCFQRIKAYQKCIDLPDDDSIFAFIEKYPESQAYFLKKIEDLSALRQVLRKFDMFQAKSIGQFLFMIKVLSSKNGSLTVEWNQQAWNLVIQYAHLIPSEVKVINWGQLSENRCLNLTQQIIKYQQILLNMLITLKLQEILATSELCEKENSKNVLLIELHKEIAYLRLLLILNEGKFISRESIRRQLQITLHLQILESTCLNSIVDYQAKYSPEELNNIKRMYEINQNEGSLLYSRLYTFILRFNYVFWQYLPKFSPEEQNELLINMDVYLTHLSTTNDSNQILKCLKRMKNHLSQPSNPGHLSLQLYNHHKELSLQFYAHIWNHSHNCYANQKTVIQGRQYLQYIVQCRTFRKDPVKSYENLLKLYIKSQFHDFFPFMLLYNHEKKGDKTNSIMLNDKIYRGSMNKTKIIRRVGLDLFQQLQNWLIPQYFKFSIYFIRHLINNVLNLPLIIKPEPESIIQLKNQLPQNPLVLTEQNEESFKLELIVKEVELTKKLFSLRNEKDPHEIVYLVTALMSDCNEPNKKALIQSLLVQLNKDMAQQSLNKDQFTKLFVWRQKLIKLRKDIIKMDQFSESYLENQFKIFTKMRQNSLNITLYYLEQLIPTRINDKQTKIYLHLILSTGLKLSQKMAYFQEDSIKAFVQMILKIMKFNEPEFDIYIEHFLKHVSPSKYQIFTSFFITLLDKESEMLAMEADVRGYFLKEQESALDDTQQIIRSPLSKFTNTFKVKYQHSLQTFIHVVSKFVQKSVVHEGGQQIVYLTYDRRNSFEYSELMTDKFINWKPSELFRRLIKQIMQLTQNESMRMFWPQLQTFQNIIYYHPEALPFIVMHPITIKEKTMPLIDFLVEQMITCLNAKIYFFIFYVCLDHSCLVKSKSKTTFFSQYLCYRIIRHIINKGFTSKSLILIFFLTQLKRFNIICKLKLNQEQRSMVDELTQFLKASRNGFERTNFLNFFIIKILGLIHQYDIIDNLKRCYSLNKTEQNKRAYSLVEDCLIPFNIISFEYDRQKCITFIGDLSQPIILQQAKQMILSDEFQSLQNHLTCLYQQFYSPLSETIIEQADFQQLKEVNLPKIIQNFGEIPTETRSINYHNTACSKQNTCHLENVEYFIYQLNTDKNVTNQDHMICHNDLIKQGTLQNQVDNRSQANQEIERQIEGALFESQPMVKIVFEDKEMMGDMRQQNVRNNEIQEFIDSINNLRMSLNQQFISLADVVGQSNQERKQYLQRKLLESEFDLNEENMNSQEFENYLCSKSHQLNVLTGQRQRKKEYAESKMFSLNIQRTFSSDSTGYIIDVMDENIQNILSFKRQLSQDVPYVPSNIIKNNDSHQQNRILPIHLFSQIKQDLLFQVLISVYYQCLYIDLEFIDSFIKNKRTQSKVINTLLSMIRNPFDSEHFPKQLYKYNEEKMKWSTLTEEDEESQDQRDILVERIVFDVILPAKRFCFYENPEFLMEEIGLEGFNGIVLEPNPKYRDLASEGKHIPIFELLEVIFECFPNKVGYFIKNLQVLPNNLVNSFFQFLMENDKKYAQRLQSKIQKNQQQANQDQDDQTFDQYDSLKMLFSCQNFILGFRKTYAMTDNRPNICFITSLINTQAYSTKQMRILHIQYFSKFKEDPEILIFLNKVLAIYSDQQLSSVSWLLQYRQLLIPIIDQIKKKKLALQNEPIYRLLQFPHLINFELKQKLLELELEKLRPKRYDNWEDPQRFINVKSGKDIFKSTYEKLKDKPKEFWLTHFQIKFEDENGVLLSGTGPGVNKEWYTLVSKAMVNLDYGLFIRTSSDAHYFSRQSHVNPRHLQYFEFIGKLFGLSILEPTYFVCPHFSQVLYKRILSQPIEIEDLIAEKFEEGEFYRQMSILQSLENKEQFDQLGIEGLKFTYATKRLIGNKNYQLIKDDQQGKLKIKSQNENSKLFLKEEQIRIIDPNAKDTQNLSLVDAPQIKLSIINIGQEIELLPDGQSIEVTFDNRLLYLKLLREKIIETVVGQTDRQFQRFVQGIKAVVNPKLLLSYRFTAEQLRDHIEGFSSISVQNLRVNTIINHFKQNDKVIEWFFDILTQLTPEDLSHFIHYWTGEPKILRKGFEGMRMTIKKSPNNSFRAQTCYNLLFLPEYKEKEQLRQIMMTAIEGIKQNKADIEN